MVDHATWLHKVKAELKSKSLESLDYIWDSERVSPFEDFRVHARLLWPQRSGMWDIHADIVWDVDPHRQLLDALNLGAGSIGICIDNNRNWKVLLKDIHLDWIKHQWYLTNIERMGTFLASLPKAILPSLIGTCWIPRVDQSKAIEQYQKVLPQFKFISTRVDSDEGSRSIADSFNHIIQTIKKGIIEHIHQSTFASTAVEFIGGDDLILNISMLRALRLVWKQVLNSFDQDPNAYDLYIAAKIKNESKSGSDHMIRASLIATSVVLGGADSVSIAAQEDSDPGLGWGLKAQHIMHYESMLDKIIDPFSGSLVVERLTDMIAKKIWDQIDG